MNIFFLLSLVLCGVVATPISTTKNNNQRIIGGFNANPRQFPYQVSIRKKSLKHFCGGSIINNQWILTSAYCSGLLKPIDIRIVVGSIYLNSGGTTHTALYTLEHPEYSAKEAINNIGLIRVNDKIKFNSFVQSIKLFNGDTAVNLPLKASGWGITTAWGILLRPSNTLQYITLRVNSLNHCRDIFYPTMPDTQLCTGTFNPIRQGLCNFDHGDPLVYNETQHAVASVVMYCLTLLPNRHTRVAPYLDWIEKVVN